MSLRHVLCLCIGLMLGATALNARADTPPFNEEQTRALQELIQGAVVRALSDSSVKDGNPQTQPPATVVLEHQAPGLNEAQRVALARMVDEAVHRVLVGETNIADAAKPGPVAPQTDPESDAIDPDLPMTNLTMPMLEKLAKEQGFPLDSARQSLETDAGAVQSALVLTNTGLNTSPTSPSTSSVQILAVSEGSRVSLKIDRSSSAADALGNGVYWSRGLVFSAPIDKDSTEGTKLIGLDGLANGFEVAYNATRIRTGGLGRRAKGEPSLLFQMPAACKSLGIAINECDYSILLRVAEEKSKSSNKTESEQAAKIAYDFALPGKVWVQGFTLKAGHDELAYFDPLTLAKHSQDEVPWSTGIFAGVLRGTSYYAGGLDYQRTFEGATAGTACPTPDPATGISRCVSGALGPPSSDERHLLTMEGRWLLGERALGLKLVHDFKNDHWGVDMPIFLFPNDKGLLYGGLRFGWTDVDQFSAGIFVGVPFKLFD